MNLLPLARGTSARPLAALFLVLSANAAGAHGPDPYADVLVSFAPGVDGAPGYDDPLTALGPPERFTGEDLFPGVVSVFSPPFGFDEIVSLGCGGVLVVAFDEPIADDPANPYGIDLLVFGNAGFIDDDWPNGVVGDVFGGGGGRIEVSADGAQWTPVPLVAADGPFPTNGYLDVGPYDGEPGSVASVFTRPVNPAITPEDLLGRSYAEVLAVYDGSGGGAGVDLAATGLAAVSFVRITNDCNGELATVEIDGFADVAPRLAGDATRDGRADFADILALLGAWGPCPPPPFPCSLDLDGDGGVGFGDILAVLAHWTG